MSYSTLFAFKNNTEFTGSFEYRNSHGTLPRVMAYFNVTHLGLEEFGHYDDWEWGVYQWPSVHQYEKAALLLCYDGAYVRKEHMVQLAHDLLRFHAVAYEKDRAEHFGAIAKTILNQKLYETCEYIHLHCTSFNGDYAFEIHNEEEDEWLVNENFFTDENLSFEVYDAINELKGQNNAES